MNGKCFDIGVIQTFVDGELGSAMAEDVVRHFSVCEDCASLAAQLESDNELAFAVMDQELNVLVPTERLRTKVLASIKEIEANESAGFWSSISAALGLNGLAARPGVATFAAILLFVAFAAVGLRVMNPLAPVSDDVVATASPRDTAVSNVPAGDAVDPLPGNEAEVPTNVGDSVITPAMPPRNNTVTPMRAVYQPQPRERKVIRPRRNVNRTRTAEPVMPSADLDAEAGYLRTIATLNRTVDENKDYVLRPSERVTYERNLAVVNDAIKKMKGEVRQNPRNTGAREVLRSSYKSKIDLLNSVAERSDTVASLD